MIRPKIWSTWELRQLADAMSGKPTTHQVEEACEALHWCAKVIDAADEVVRKEVSILASARRRSSSKEPS